jgi:hypothetical protein
MKFWTVFFILSIMAISIGIGKGRKSVGPNK